MREKCGPISGIRKELRIEESQRQDMFEAETVTLAVPVNERDHLVGPEERAGYSGQLWRLPVMTVLLSVFAPVNTRYLLFICSQLQPAPTALTKLAAIPVS